MSVDSGIDNTGGPGTDEPAAGGPSERAGISIVTFAGMASLAAGAVHAAAAGIHSEHPQLARIFVVCAALQLGTGLWALVRPSKLAAWLVVAVNLSAVGGVGRGRATPTRRCGVHAPAAA